MGLFGKKAEPVIEEPVVVEEVKEEVKRPTQKTVIGAGITMVGDFETKEEIVINGTVKGDIHSTTDVSISETGVLHGNASAENLYVDGSVDGEIEIKNLTKLSDTANVVGTLTTGKFVTAEGSYFDGQLTMKTSKVSKPVEPAAEESEAE